MVQYLEKGMVDLAKGLGYKAVICMNTNPVTQHVAVSELGYKRLKAIQINQHVSARTKTKMFPVANDEIIVTIDGKFLQ